MIPVWFNWEVATKCGYNVEGRGPQEQPNHAGTILFDVTKINQIEGGGQKIYVILQIKTPTQCQIIQKS